MYRFLTLVLALFLLPAFVAHAADKDYKLGSGDVVRITLYDHPDLTTEARVSDTGVINFPLIGETTLGGMTLRQAENAIALGLDKGGFIKQPQVNIMVLQYRGQQVSVLGQVNRPGKYPLEKASTLSDTLALAGGIIPTGADEAILIRHSGGKVSRQIVDTVALFQKGQTELDLDVADGDIIFVPRQPLFYIYGEVQRPGAFRLERNMSVVQALSVGGGLTLRGTQKGIKIIRRDARGQMQEVEAGLSTELQPDDVIYVKESLF